MSLLQAGMSPACLRQRSGFVARSVQSSWVLTAPISHCAHNKKDRLQGEDPDYMWAVVVLGYWARLFAGIIAAALSVAWLLHIALCAPHAIDATCAVVGNTLSQDSILFALSAPWWFSQTLAAVIDLCMLHNASRRATARRRCR